MRNWKYKINVANFYHDDELTIKQKAKKMKLVINSFIEHNIKDEYSEIYVNGQYLAMDFSDVKCVENFDDVMERLYDWSDENGVWIETRG